MLLLFFESQKKLLENSYLDDSIVCIVGKKVDNKLTNSPYVSLLWDIATDILVAKKLGVYLKVSYRYSFCFDLFMTHIYSTWPLFFVTNGPLGPFFSELYFDCETSNYAFVNQTLILSWNQPVMRNQGSFLPKDITKTSDVVRL